MSSNNKMSDDNLIKELVHCLWTINNELEDSEKKGLKVDRQYIKIQIGEVLKLSLIHISEPTRPY